jgi:hypothetical protein
MTSREALPREQLHQRDNSQNRGNSSRTDYKRIFSRDYSENNTSNPNRKFLKKLKPQRDNSQNRE